MPARGRCHYRGCGKRAVVHLKLAGGLVSWACSAHEVAAVEWWRPRDRHLMGALCALVHAADPSLRWHFSTPQHEGFCFRVDPDWAVFLADESREVANV